MSTPPKQAAQAILLAFKSLLKLDKVTGLASVELWVLLTTVLLVVRFLFDFSGPWFGNPRRMFLVLTLEVLNQNLVIYTMGLMQLSSSRVNDYFQVWAVLLVTLQYSVKIGRPYTRSKQIPLLDLMSSFWSANLLRVQTFYLLRIPLWLIWSLNAVRIITLFVTSGTGEKLNQESMRLVSDYMSYEDTLPTRDDQEQSEMSGCKYLVHGEHRVLRQVQKDPVTTQHSYKIQLDPDDINKDQLVTVEKLWNNETKESSRLLGRGSTGADPGNLRKDLCLSFALYKLLRRRFYDLPMHELTRNQGKEKMSRLVFGYILSDSDRAFRITGVELSFLRDLFYSKHATMFAGSLWVPFQSLLLSLCLATATGYIAYPARYIPGRMDPSDRNRITHGVFITRLIIAIIVVKELSEIVLYFFSRWANVLMLCKHVQHRCWRRPVVEKAIMFMCSFSTKPKLNRELRQQNLLVQVRVLRRGRLPLLTIRMEPRRGVIYGRTRLSDYTKNATLDLLKNLKDNDDGLALDNYLSNAFNSSSCEPVWSGTPQPQWPSNLEDLKVDTHIILVWHIATCLCEIYFFKKVQELKAVRRPQPFVRGPKGTRHKRKSRGSAAPEQDEFESESVWSEQYATAVSLSNYCAYLVMKSLVPDSDVVASSVLHEVIEEIDCVVSSSSSSTAKVITNGVRKKKIGSSMTLQDVYDCLMETTGKTCKNPEHRQGEGPDMEAAATTQEESDKERVEEEDFHHIGCSLTRMGAELGKQLIHAYEYEGDAPALWRGLANFWMGFLLHLAANTRAGTHGKHLADKLEFITHLWALLTHAGFRGNAVNEGEQGLDQDDLPDIDQAIK